MRILLFSGGFTEYIIELANELANISEDNMVMLVLPDRIREEYKAQINNKVIFCPIHFIDYVSFRQNYKMTLALIKLINAFAPDVFHVQADGQHPWLGWVLPFIKKKCKIINTVHDPKPHIGDKISVYRDMQFSKWMFKKYADAYIVHGKTLKVALVDGYKIKTDLVHIIPHGHLNMYRNFQKGAKKTENPFAVLFFGRIWEYKGLKYLMQAEPIIRKEIPELKIIIAGTGEDLYLYEPYLVNKDSYEFKNYRIPIEDVSDLFDEAAVVVLPYIEATQSGVIPIAYPFSKAVVATNVGALPEVVVDGLTGFLIPPANPEAIAEKIIYLLKNPDLRKEMGNNAQKYSDDNLNWKKIAHKTMEVYKNA